ncbi:hypothetical protein [Streptomyces sp. AK02-01A]|uniref:hypothetical protein n=1 Tax=Streptomyces sp. AK02-01A TaxID=3028648 RepID=UPI0029AEF682|nr:hypothetical protein [Streptomyces sp. AK02-01A]MDX3851492.1 hypothetical protein [Streptomyces sp. AK02-01A]
MHIDWTALGSVFGVSLAATIGLVGLFTLGVVGLAKQPPAPAAGSGGAAAAVRAGAYVCFALCGAAVAYGIHLIVV